MHQGTFPQNRSLECNNSNPQQGQLHPFRHPSEILATSMPIGPLLLSCILLDLDTERGNVSINSPVPTTTHSFCF